MFTIIGRNNLDRIVAVSKDPGVQQLAQQYGREVFGADDPADAMDIVQTVNPDLILLDHRFELSHIQEYLQKADNDSGRIPVVIVGSDDGDADMSAMFMQMGAYGYLQGMQDHTQMEMLINNIQSACFNTCDISDEREQIQVTHKTNNSLFFADELADAVSMAGRSSAVTSALKMIRLVAGSTCNPILIVGETGTGKELVARAIHTHRHPNEPFVAINCAALTATLLESELFGHVKGSFTGADRDKVGLLELAGSGTLLLDEISEMPMELQAKLLRVLQEKNFRKVGGIRNISCKATIIASSNRNLSGEVRHNRFRRDLYYRLNVSPIVLAPLRSPERREDIKLLAKYFLETSNICPEKRNKVTSLTKLAIEALEKHDWPGNIRELRNVIDRAILLETTDKVGLSSIVIDPTECGQAADSPAASLIKGFSLAKAERELIARALQETGWQKTRAAALLGITRATLYAKVKQYSIKKGSQDAKNTALSDLEEAAASSIPAFGYSY